MYQISKLSVYREEYNPILENINLDSTENQAISIIGKNGSGKSSLAFALIGLIPTHFPHKVEGSFVINNIDILSLSFTEKLSLISYVFQDTESQILFGNVKDILGLNEENTDKNLINELINIFDIGFLLDKKPNELSSGESRKVALISAVKGFQKLIIYDEATSALDPKAKFEFTKIIEHLLNNRKNIILLGQNHNLLKNYSTAQYFITDKILRTSTEKSTLDYSQLRKVVSNFITKKEKDFKLNIEKLFHSYKKWNYNLDVQNLTISQGETIAIVGENGSGKSTFINSIIGFVKPKKLNTNIPITELRENIYNVFTSPALQILEATIKKEIEKVNCDLLKNYEDLQQFFPFLELDKDPFTLSFGQQRLLTFLQAITSNMEVLIFDEPELGLDDDNIELIKQLLLLNLSERKKTILFVTHNIELAEKFSSRIIKFHNGQIQKDELNHSLSISKWFDI